MIAVFSSSDHNGSSSKIPSAKFEVKRCCGFLDISVILPGKSSEIFNSS